MFIAVSATFNTQLNCYHRFVASLIAFFVGLPAKCVFVFWRIVNEINFVKNANLLGKHSIQRSIRCYS